MKKIYRIISSLLLSLILTLGMATTAVAAGSSVTYEGGAEDFVFLPGSGYTDTDLFDGFKNVMPGDVLTEKITVKNSCKGCDYVKVYMRAKIHNEEVNPLTYSESYEAKDGKDQAGTAGQRDETVSTMTQFLKQLSMKVKLGDKVIYEASPDELDGLRGNVLLGSFHYGESAELTVELTVPAELGNEYADRVGEVDWVFAVEEHNHSHSGGDDGSDSTAPAPSSPVNPSAPKTGDGSNAMLWAGLAGLSLLALALVFVSRRRKQGEE